MATTSGTGPVSHLLPRVALGAAMLGATVFGSAADRGLPWLLCLGLLLLIGSMVLGGSHWVISEVRRVNRPADDAFTEGYEAGYDRGWRDRDAEARPNLVLLDRASASLESADSCDHGAQLTAESVAKR